MRLIYFFIFIFLSSSSYSQDHSPFLKIQKFFGEKLDFAQGFASEKIFYATNRIDSFFGDARAMDYDNGSRLRLYSISEKREHQNATHDFNYKFQIRLPALQKKLQLELFKSEGSVEKNTPANEEIIGADQDTSTSTPRLGLAYALEKLRGFETRIGTGVKLAIPPDAYIYARSRKDFLFDNFIMSFHTSLFYSVKDNLTENLTFNFDRKVSDSLLFRLNNEFSHNESVEIIRTSHGPSLYQVLSDRRSLSYNFRANFSDEYKYSITNYIFQLDLRQRIYKKWVYYDLIPYIDWPKVNDFKRTHGIIFKLELIFGES